MSQIITPNKETPPVTIGEFLVNVAPGSLVDVQGNLAIPEAANSNLRILNIYPITLFCDNPSCTGFRQFGTTNTMLEIAVESAVNLYWVYTCRNCGTTSKTYSFRAYRPGNSGRVKMVKYGEMPSFGPPTPPRIISLLRAEKDYYAKGRRAENQGMGIAAFAYYRRVVENQKTQLIEAIIAVSQKIGADEATLKELRDAQKETQFHKAVGAIKHGIPQSLLVGGHNPLTLLHDALSEGLHAQTDEECLAIATSIRVILTDLVDRIALALEEHQELTGAVSKLLQIKSQRSKGNSKPQPLPPTT